MKKTSADGLTMAGVKLDSNLSEKVEAVAKASGQSASAVIRAAMYLGLPALLKTPESVAEIDAGTMKLLTYEQIALKYHSLMQGGKAQPPAQDPTLHDLVRGTATAANPQQSTAFDIMDNLHAMSISATLGLNEPGGEDRLWRLLRPILLPRIVEEINSRLPAEKGSKPPAGK